MTGRYIITQSTNGFRLHEPNLSVRIAPATHEPNISVNIPPVREDTATKILEKMNNFRCAQTFCDIVLCGDGNRQYHAHKLVLSAVSPYFAAMFQTNMSEKGKKIVKIKDVDSQALGCLIEFAYTGKITPSVDSIFLLLAAANMLCFEDVEKSCVHFLCANLNIENCVDICSIADTINCEELHRIATLYVSTNFRQLVNSSSFISLTSEQLGSVLSKDNVNVSSEVEVFEAVVTWVKHDRRDRMAYLPDLLKNVRFVLMSRKYLVDRVLHDGWIMQHEKCREIVLKALDRHLLPERLINDKSPSEHPRLVTNRTLYVLGGEIKDKSRSSAECYDFQLKKWCPVTPMLIARKYVSAAVLDGMLYAVGGICDDMDLVTVEMYDPNKEQWTPVASLSHCRGALSVVVMDGWLYAIGGSSGRNSLKDVEQYDSLTNTWTAVPSMRLPRSNFGAAGLRGKIYAVGGYCGISEVEHCEYYEPSFGKWFEVTGLNKSRMHHHVVCCKDRLYAFGGKNSMGLLKSIEKYNPDLNLWLVIKINVELSLGMNICLGFSPENDCDDVFVVGGIDETGEERKEVKHVSLKSPEFLVKKGTSMLEKRKYMGIALL